MTSTSIRAATADSRVRHLLSAAWGTIAGIAPHVLHHVGPLAGAAILASTGGRILFFVLGVALAIPMLVRLYRRFRSWVAPAIAIAVFAVTYGLSSIFLGPLISGTNDGSASETPAATSTIDEHGHPTNP